MSVKIVTDSTCDLPADVIAKLGITVLPLYINFGSQSRLDGVDLSRREFYEQLPRYNPPPTTAAPGVDMFRSAYERLAREGATEILSIHISISLSAVVNVARVAAQETKVAPVAVFDSRQLSMGTGLLVQAAAQAANAGATTQEIIVLLQDLVPRTHAFALLDTLEYLRRSGRMNGALATMGNLLQVKPLLRMYDGKPTAERIRTRERGVERMVEIIAEIAPLERAALIHTHAPERAEALRQRIQQLLPQDDVPSVEVTPTIGAHVGPGAVGFACVTKG